MPLALVPRRGASPAAGGPPPIRETDLDRILKLIPTESLALYLSVVALADEIRWRYVAVVAFILGAAVGPLVLYLDGRSTGQRARWPQYIVRAVAFAVWSSASAWPFTPWLTAVDVRWVAALGVLLVPLAGAFALRDR